MLKYKNYVFDMGCTLIDYDSTNVIKHYTNDKALIKKIDELVFLSGEWIMLDAGLIREEEGIAKILTRFENEQEKELAEKCFWNWHLYNMWPKEGMAEVVRTLKEKGARVYVLSNASIRLLSCYRDYMPAAELYDGVLFSAEIQYIKPQEVIYQKFFERFSLKPEECFFIDDLKRNIEGSRNCGMDGYVFDGDVKALKRILGI